MPHRNISELLELPVSERIQLVEDLWDSIATEPEAVQLNEEQGLELDRRLESHRASPEAAIPWVEVRKKLVERL
jgi:putative addiction module component (TIGR02574 family)